ncbi:MAG TPA: MoaD/ThiS family protein [Candidatus Eremiobacteraceae bacterium]|nr:MoaD/ThiS family protein [Candidatus Eremiobacteraceae bacterium]
MRVTIRLFAVHRETAGKSTFAADLPDGATVADAFARLCDEYPGIRAGARSVAFAVNRAHASEGDRLRDGDEVAFLPPVAGG